jgi:single-strand DNA-binding protein
MQKITIIGRLGRDPRKNESQSGRAFTSFTVAVNDRYRGEDRTYWYDVMAFDPDRFNVLKYIKKGSSVVVVGTLHAEAERGNDGTYRCVRSITADSIDFTPSSQSGSTESNETRQAPASSTQRASKPAAKPAEDDLPPDEPVEIPVKPRASAKKTQPAKVSAPDPEPEPPVDEEEMPF